MYRRGEAPVELPIPRPVEGQAIDTEDGEEDDEFIVHAPPPPKEPAELTPQGNVRSTVTEADDNEEEVLFAADPDEEFDFEVEEEEEEQFEIE